MFLRELTFTFLRELTFIFLRELTFTFLRELTFTIFKELTFTFFPASRTFLYRRHRKDNVEREYLGQCTPLSDFV